MPRASEERTNRRKEEIIEACASLYETMSFKDITMQEISNATSFTRTSIYNYFHTKEEIFLALLQKEYELWIGDLRKMTEEKESMTSDELASELAHSLERRGRLLKILSMNHYDMETNCRMERLVEFKSVYRETLHSVARCLEKFRCQMTPEEIRRFLYAFFPFLFGIYPYTVVTEKQKQAMEAAGVNYAFLSIYDITYSFVKMLLEATEK